MNPRPPGPVCELQQRPFEREAAQVTALKILAAASEAPLLLSRCRGVRRSGVCDGVGGEEERRKRRRNRLPPLGRLAAKHLRCTSRPDPPTPLASNGGFIPEWSQSEPDERASEGPGAKEAKNDMVSSGCITGGSRLYQPVSASVCAPASTADPYHRSAINSTTLPESCSSRNGLQPHCDSTGRRGVNAWYNQKATRFPAALHTCTSPLDSAAASALSIPRPPPLSPTIALEP